MDYYNEEFNFVRQHLKNSAVHYSKRMLIFINVLSGQGKALHVFMQAAMPYFTAGSIKYDVVAVTSPTSGIPFTLETLQDTLQCENLLILSGRISDYIQSMDPDDIEKYDAFIVVGGDGTLGELATGCVLFAQRQKQSDSNKFPSISPDSDLWPFRKPIGIIPAGSTDAFACTLFGTRDPHVAAIAIALGSTFSVDIQAIFADGYFAKISLSAVACGFLTDTLIKLKSLQKLGPAKSVVAAMFALLHYKPSNVAVQYRPRENVTATSCTFKCSSCARMQGSNLPRNSSMSAKSDWRWAPIEPGPIVVLNAYSTPVRLPGGSSGGIAPLCHLCDGTAHIFVIPHSPGRFHLLACLIAILRGSVGTVYFQKNSFIKITAIRSCCEYRITAKPPVGENVESGMLASINWNIDGEVISANSVQSVVHSRLLTFFGTGGPLPPPKLFSTLFFARIAKVLLPSVILNESPLKKPTLLCSCGTKDWLLCNAKRQISSSSVSRLIFLFGLCVTFFTLLLFYYFFSFYVDLSRLDLQNWQTSITYNKSLG